MIQYCLKPRIFGEKSLYNPPFVTLRSLKRKTNQIFALTQPFDAKLYLQIIHVLKHLSLCVLRSYDIVHIETFICGKLTLALTRFYEILSRFSVGVVLEFGAVTNTTRTLLRANFGSMCFVWSNDVTVHAQELGF